MILKMQEGDSLIHGYHQKLSPIQSVFKIDIILLSIINNEIFVIMIIILKYKYKRQENVMLKYNRTDIKIQIYRETNNSILYDDIYSRI